MAKEFAKKGHNVLVIDGDESNLSLHKLLGMDLPKDFIEYLGGRKEFMKKLREKWMVKKLSYLRERYL